MPGIPVYPPSLRCCHSLMLVRRLTAQTAPASTLPPSGVSLRSTLSSPALLPCCTSSFPRHYRQGSGSRATVLRCAPTDARQPPPFATVPLSLRRRQHRSNAPPPHSATQIVRDDARRYRQSPSFLRHSGPSADDPLSIPHNLLAPWPRLPAVAPKRKSCSGTT